MINYMTATAATVQNDSKTISVTGESVDFSKIDDNYVVLLDNGLYVMPVVSGTAPDGNGDSTLTLVDTWEGAALTNKKLLVLPVFAKIYETVTAMTALNDVTRGILGKLNDVLTSTDATVNIPIGVTSSVDVTPIGYMDNQIQNYISSLNDEIANITETTRNEVNLALNPKNKIIYDDQGNPNAMVWINKFNSEDVNAAILARHGIDMQLGTGVFPAFIKDGVHMRGFWYAKYRASRESGIQTSVKGGGWPWYYLDYDAAKAACVAKGAGWHLSSNLEWMAVALLNMAYCEEQPRGDTDYGRAHDAKHEVGKRDESDKAPGDTAYGRPIINGTGPNTWSHDGTSEGVFDLVGGLWEWQDQIKLQDGRIYAPLDNNPDLSESLWPAHDCYLDSTGASSGEVILNSSIVNRLGTIGDNANSGTINQNTWTETTSSASYIANEFMRQIGVEPTLSSLKGQLYSRNYGERLPLRGGRWVSGSSAGLGALYFLYSRSYTYSNVGFRPALFEI